MDGRLGAMAGRLRPLPEGKCLAGVSGGADSVALLLTLREAGAEVEAVHVNHGLRGGESDGDEAFVRDLCARLGVPFHAARADLRGRKDENAARDARWACFRECAERTGIRTLALAHHADDQAETFMMRLIRGAGPEGLGCMKPAEERDGILVLRPMLGIRRAEIREALTEAGETWREDRSNEDDRYFRNRVRSRLMPLLEEMTPGAAERIAGAAAIIAAENEWAEAAARQYLDAHAGPGWIDGAVGREPEALRRRILRQWWRDNAPPRKERALSAEQTERLAALAASERGKISLPGGMRAVKGRQALHLTGAEHTEPDAVPVAGGETAFGAFRLECAPGGKDPGDGKRTQEVPAALLDGCVIRTRRPGDRISPFGMKGRKKLQDYLTDRGIDEPWRDRIPLICREGEVLLAAGVGAGNVPAWNPAENNIRLTWIGDMPWMR